jgi:hypothetical protein
MITMLVPNGSVFELVERQRPILREEDQKHSTENRALGEVPVWGKLGNPAAIQGATASQR